MDVSVIRKEISYNPETGKFFRILKDRLKPIDGGKMKRIKVGGKPWPMAKLAWILSGKELPYHQSRADFGFKNGDKNDFRIDNLVPLWDDGQDLTPERLRELFDYKDGFLYRKYTIGGQPQGKVETESSNTSGYSRVSIFGERYLLHRLIWMWHHGEIPEGMFVDHIDRNHDNNRFENLRLVNAQFNAMNRQTKDRDGLPMGIDYRPDKSSIKPYKARIKVNGKQYEIGSYATLDEAIAARRGAEAFHGFQNNNSFKE